MDAVLYLMKLEKLPRWKYHDSNTLSDGQQSDMLTTWIMRGSEVYITTDVNIINPIYLFPVLCTTDVLETCLLSLRCFNEAEESQA